MRENRGSEVEENERESCNIKTGNVKKQRANCSKTRESQVRQELSGNAEQAPRLWVEKPLEKQQYGRQGYMATSFVQHLI